MDLISLIDQTKTIVMLIKEGNVAYANAYAKIFFGYDNMIGLPVVGTIVPAMESSGRNLEKLIESIEINPEQHRLHVNENVTRRGDHVWIIWSNSQYVTSNNEQMVLSVGMEVTDIIKRQQSLESVFTGSLDGIAFLDPEFNIVDYNASFMNMLGFDSEEEMREVRKDESSSYGEYLRGFIYKILDILKESDSVRLQHVFNKYNGTSFVVDGFYSKIRSMNGDVIGYAASLRDNTEMYKKATTDTLTKICNKMHFEELAEKEINNSLRYGKQLSLILCDVDHFKAVNDTYGHLCGDVVLREMASEIKHMLRDSDIFARIGGEEFAILLPVANGKAAYKVAEKIRKAIKERHFICGDKKLKITMSFGISEFNSTITEAKTLKELYELADKRLYYSKAHGRDRVTCTEVAFA